MNELREKTNNCGCHIIMNNFNVICDEKILLYHHLSLSTPITTVYSKDPSKSGPKPIIAL